MQKLVCKAVVVACLALGATAQAAVPEWIEQSNANAQPLLELMAKYAPESAAAYGVEGHDADIVDLQPGYDVRMEADIAELIGDLEAKLPTTTDSRVGQDLRILVQAARDQQVSSALNRRETAVTKPTMKVPTSSRNPTIPSSPRVSA